MKRGGSHGRRTAETCPRAVPCRIVRRSTPAMAPARRHGRAARRPSARQPGWACAFVWVRVEDAAITVGRGRPAAPAATDTPAVIGTGIRLGWLAAPTSRSPSGSTVLELGTPARRVTRVASRAPPFRSSADNHHVVGAGAVAEVINDRADDGVHADRAREPAEDTGEVFRLGPPTGLEIHDGVAMRDGRECREGDRDRHRPGERIRGRDGARSRDRGEHEEGRGQEPPRPTDRPILWGTAASGFRGSHGTEAWASDEMPSSLGWGYFGTGWNGTR